MALTAAPPTITNTILLQNTEAPEFFGLGSMDIVYDKGGHLVEIEGTEKLKFLILKSILTAPYTIDDVTVGSALTQLIGIKYAGVLPVESIMSIAVEKAIKNFQNSQPLNVPDAELMTRINGVVRAVRDPDDPYTVVISASIENGEGTIVPITHSFTIWAT